MEREDIECTASDDPAYVAAEAPPWQGTPLRAGSPGVQCKHRLPQVLQRRPRLCRQLSQPALLQLLQQRQQQLWWYPLVE